MILHPSLASANPLHYGRELTALDNLDFGSLHLDIEDSSFINNITFGMKTVQAVARQTPHPLSFHFMVARPQRWFNALAEIRPAWINYKKCPIFLNLTNDNDNKSRLLHAFSFFITNKKINFYLTLPH